MSILYDSIMRLCAKRGISGYRLAEDLAISKSIFTDLKMGRKKGLSADIAAKIADYFGVTVTYLLTGGQQDNQFVQPQKTPPGEDAELTEYLEDLRERPEMKMLFSLAKNATKEDVEASVRIIKAYLNKDNDDL